MTYNSSTSDENGNYAFNAMANHSCDTGFVLVGDNTRTCTGDGSSTIGVFDGEAAICERELMLNPCFNVVSVLVPPCTYIVTCVLPAPPLNGALLTNTSPTESSVLTFQCDPGFSRVGTEISTCNNSGLWDPDPALLECKFIYVSMHACMLHIDL